jgi:UDP-glucose 4-epimerase
MTFLVTGGFGFIGYQLVQALVQTGERVRILAPGPSPESGSFNGNVTIVRGRTGDADALKRAMDGTSICFHMAGVELETDPRRSRPTQSVMHKKHAKQFFDCASALGNIPIVYASSAAVYRPDTFGPILESTDLTPVNAHGAEKLILEKQAAAAFDQNGVPSLGLRFFNVYGSTQSLKSKYCGAVRRFIDFVKNGEPIPLYGNGKQVRDWIHVDDAVNSMLKVARSSITGADVINIGTGVGTSTRDVAEMVEACSGISAIYDVRPITNTDVMESVAEVSKAARLLGFRAQISLEEGVSRMIDELEAHG